jgi:IS5 family transposase
MESESLQACFGRFAKSPRILVEQVVDRTQEVKHEILAIAKLLKRRTNQSWEEINAITSRNISIADTVVTEAQLALEILQEKGREATKTVEKKLTDAVSVTRKIIDQSKQVVAGNRNIPNRIVSIFDQGARAIKKGKLGKTGEFGYKVRIDDTESGIVTGYKVYEGNPSDKELLVGAVENHKQRFNSAPHAVATDRGFTSRANEEKLKDMGVERVSTPKCGKKSKAREEHEAQHWFQNLQRFRAGGEAKISLLKRKYGLDLSRYRGVSGSKSWVGIGIWAHNLKLAAQMA